MMNKLEKELFEISRSSYSGLTLRVWMFLRSNIKPGAWKAFSLEEIASHVESSGTSRVSAAIALLETDGWVLKKNADPHLRKNVNDKMFGIPERE